MLNFVVGLVAGACVGAFLSWLISASKIQDLQDQLCIMEEKGDEEEAP